MLTLTESRAAVSSSLGIVTGFSGVTWALAHDEAAVDLTGVIGEAQVRTLAVPLITRVREVVHLYRREFPKRVWFVAPLGLQFLQMW